MINIVIHYLIKYNRIVIRRAFKNLLQI